MGAKWSRIAILIGLALVLTTSYNNCVKSPTVATGLQSLGYQHTGKEVTCANCHEQDRPAVAGSIVHGNGADCVACHGIPGTNGTSTTGDLDTLWSTVEVGPYTHTANLTSCVSCHSGNEPQPVNGFTHYNNYECAGCHNPNNNNSDGLTQDQINSAWAAPGAYNYLHAYGLSNCTTCHEKDRPAPNSSGPHGGGQDCVVCHGASDSWTSSLTETQIQYIWLSTVGQQGN